MPELPEVEIHARSLRRWLSGKRITGYEIRDPKLVPEAEWPAWDRWIRGARVLEVEREAKYLLIHLEGGRTLVVHLRMTGKWLYETYAAAPPGKFTRLVLHLEDGSAARFEDVRRFGRVWLTPTDEVRQLPELSELGPDALLAPTSQERLREITAGAKRSIKILCTVSGEVRIQVTDPIS